MELQDDCDDDNQEVEMQLRERRPTAANEDELLQLMQQTCNARRAWIQAQQPSISQIFQRYPRLADMSSAVR